MIIPTPSAWFLTTNNVLEDRAGNNTLSQNSSTNTVTAFSDNINGKNIICGYFSGIGTNGGSSNTASNPNGNYPYLYRNSLIIGTNNVTISYWVKTDTVDPSNYIPHIYERGTSYGYVQIYSYHPEHVSVPNLITTQYGDSGRSTYYPSVIPEYAKWNHIYYRKSGSTVMLTVNGVKQDNVTVTSAGGASTFRLGGSRNGLIFLRGFMHDVRIWVGQVLSDEIGQELFDVYDKPDTVKNDNSCLFDSANTDSSTSKWTKLVTSGYRNMVYNSTEHAYMPYNGSANTDKSAFYASGYNGKLTHGVEVTFDLKHAKNSTYWAGEECIQIGDPSSATAFRMDNCYLLYTQGSATMRVRKVISNTSTDIKDYGVTMPENVYKTFTFRIEALEKGKNRISLIYDGTVFDSFIDTSLVMTDKWSVAFSGLWKYGSYGTKSFYKNIYIKPIGPPTIIGYDFKKDATDYSGNENTATPTNCTLQSTGGYLLNGTSSYITLPDIYLGNDWTEIIKINLTQNNSYIIDHRIGDTTEGLTLSINSSNKLTLAQFGQFTTSGSTTLSYNQDYIFSVVYDGTTCKVYINDDLEISQTATIVNDYYPSRIGSRTTGTTFTGGTVKHYKFIADTLDVSEIRQLIKEINGRIKYRYNQFRQGGIIE